MTTRPLVVVSNRCFPETIERLRTIADVDANGAGEPWPQDELIRRCRQAAGLLSFMTDRIDAAFLAACPRLRVIGAALKGYDNIDVAAAAQAGVWVSIVPDLLTAPTAELAIALMLGLSRNILAGDRKIRSQGFDGWRPDLYGRGLAGETVGIIGFGHVGQAIAGRLCGFGCTILACDQRDITPPEGLEPLVRLVPLPEVLAAAGYVVLALPLMESTHHLLDAAMIAQMRPGAYLINPARGSLVDEAAVAGALASGQLAGYAADVFECEDWARKDRPAYIEPRLTRIDAPTLLTPHLGSAVGNVRREIELAAAKSIIDALSGRVPASAVNQPKPRHIDAQPAAR